MNLLRRLVLCLAAFACALPWLPHERAQADPAAGMPGFEGAAGWLNGGPLTPAQLKGKVVLVDFWEYTCINCLRTLPYLREWYRRYRDDGFTIVGVHSPEFRFSGESKNVAQAARRLDVGWPIALDDKMAIWKRYRTDVWPSEYLFDRNGKLVEKSVGEGNYQVTEAKIQALLKASNPQLKLPALMALLPQDSYDKPGAVCYPQTAEILVGPGRSNAVANPPAFSDPSRDNDYVDRSSGREDGRVYLKGFWHVSPEGRREGMVSGGGDGYLALRYHAIEVVAVLKPEKGPVRVGITQDGKPVAPEDAGKDVRYDGSGNSYLEVDMPRAYDVIANKRFGSHELRLTPDGSGLGVYDVAFESCEVGADK